MDIFPEVLAHFQKLLQFDTTNPPGNEAPAIAYLVECLKREGLSPQVFDSAPGRANLVLRLRGDGTHKPLLINSHIDVVHAEADKWKYPPFSGQIADDCIWGRGAVDMKNMTAYCLGAVIGIARDLRAGKVRLKRDLIMTVVADEEVGGEFGMGFLAKKYPELIQAEYALGELGGYTIHMGGRRIYPVQVGEKGIFWIKVRFTGSPGHGSMPGPGNVHFRMARFISKLETSPLPVHLTESSTAFLNGIGAALGFGKRVQFELLKTGAGPKIVRFLAKRSADAENLEAIGAMLSNTANPTGAQSGRQHNVVPSSVTLTLDCRLLPGFTGRDVIREIESVTGEKLDDVEVVREAQGHESPIVTPLFDEIKRQLEAGDPGCVVVPNLTVGFTDAQHLKRLGTICYGFTPIRLSPGMSFPKLYHGHNERIPVEGFRWGLDVFTKTIREFCI